MVSRRVALSALLGLLVFASVLVFPPASPDTDYVVTAELPSEASDVPESVGTTDPTPYENLTADYQQVFDAALASDGTKRYDDVETYPETVTFPEEDGLAVRGVEYQGETYLLQFTRQVDTLDLRSVLSVVGGIALVVYAGYLHSQPDS
jgi:hypothetical protein